MPGPMDCAPRGPRVDADLDDLIYWDPNVKFTPDDAARPSSSEPIDLLSDMSDEARALEAISRGEPFYQKTDKQGILSHAFNSLKVRRELFKELEAKTNVPFYKWYDVIEQARHDTELAKLDTIKELDVLGRGLNKAERQQVQMLLEAKTSGITDSELSKKVSPKVSAATDELLGVYNRYFAKEGVPQKDIDDFLKQFPILREHDGDFPAYSMRSSQIPKLMTFMSKRFKTGEAGIYDHREYDSWSIARKIISAHANQKYLEPAWEATRRQMEAYAQTAQVPQDLFNYMTRYLREVRHVPDHIQLALGRTVQKINKQLLGKYNLSIPETWDVSTSLLGANYYANMAWNPGIALRNYLQTVMTTYPLAGEKYLAEGLAFYAKGVNGGMHNGQKITDMMVQRGVLTRDNVPEAARAMRDVIESSGVPSLGGRAGQTIHWLKEKGWWMHRSAEDLNRTTAYWAMFRRTEDYGKKFLEKKISWEQFVEKSHIDFLDVKGGGPFTQKIKNVLLSGDLEKAADYVGLESVARTQFVYSAGNNAYAFSGTMGRFLGQFSTWPSWYGHYVTSMFTRGSLQNRVTMMGRWAGANAAVYYGAREVFGVETAKWTFFSPFGYTGGPLAQTGMMALQQGGSAVGEGKLPFIGMFDKQTGLNQTPSDPVAKIQQARLMRAYQQVTPLPWSTWRVGYRMYEDLNDGEDWKTLSKHFLGFQEAREE